VDVIPEPRARRKWHESKRNRVTAGIIIGVAAAGFIALAVGLSVSSAKQRRRLRGLPKPPPKPRSRLVPLPEEEKKAPPPPPPKPKSIPKPPRPKPKPRSIEEENKHDDVVSQDNAMVEFVNRVRDRQQVMERLWTDRMRWTQEVIDAIHDGRSDTLITTYKQKLNKTTQDIANFIGEAYGSQHMQRIRELLHRTLDMHVTYAESSGEHDHQYHLQNLNRQVTQHVKALEAASPIYFSHDDIFKTMQKMEHAIAQYTMASAQRDGDGKFQWMERMIETGREIANVLGAGSIFPNQPISSSSSSSSPSSSSSS